MLKLFPALDPKPYIRTFEAALEELQRLQEDRKSREKTIETETQNAEVEHSKNVSQLGRSVEATMSDFGVLDGLIGDISAATSSLGDRLERLSSQHELAVSSSFLINCYLSFMKRSECPELVNLWEGHVPGGRRKCANVVRQLQSLSRRMEDLNEAQRPQEHIDKFAEKLEKDLLTDFDNAYRAADLAAMKESADLLTDFNGGGSVVQIFVNQHDFFIVQEKLVDTSKMDDNEMWVKLSDPDGTNEEFEGTVQDIMDEIRGVAATETDIIRKVFRDPGMVLKVFLQRIFAQRIQQQLEAYLIAAETVSMLAYVRVLHICYTKVGSLVKGLKDLFNQEDLDSDGELSSLLDQNFGDIFVPYIENGRYWEAEKKSIQDVVNKTVANFMEIHTHKKLIRDQSLLGRFASSLDSTNKDGGSGNSSGGNASNEKGTSGSNSGSGEVGRIGQFMRKVRLERSNSNNNDNNKKTASTQSQTTGAGSSNNDVESEFDEQDSEIQLDHIQNILKVAAEGVNRDLELAPPSEVAKDAESLLDLLLEWVGKSYIDLALDDAVNSTAQETKNEVSLNYLKVICKTSTAVHLLSTFVKTVLFSMVSGSSSSAQKGMITTLNNYVVRTEEKSNSILNGTVDLVLTRTAHILAKQKKKQFLPREDTSYGVGETEVCQEISTFLHDVYESAQDAFDGENLQSFLVEIGIGFRDALMDHIKKFTINAGGGVILARDIQGYQHVIDQWSISELSESFSILHGIGNLYTAQPQVLMSLLKDSNLAQLKPYVIREYLSKRLDYYTSSINKMVATGSIPTQQPAPSTSAPRNLTYPIMM